MTYSIEALSNSTQFFKISGQFYWGQAHSIPNQIIHIFSKSKFIYALHEKYDFLSLMIRYLWNAYQSLSILIVWFTTHKKYNKKYWLYMDVQTFLKKTLSIDLKLINCKRKESCVLFVHECRCFLCMFARLLHYETRGICWVAFPQPISHIWSWSALQLRHSSDPIKVSQKPSQGSLLF